MSLTRGALVIPPCRPRGAGSPAARPSEIERSVPASSESLDSVPASFPSFPGCGACLPGPCIFSFLLCHLLHLLLYQSIHVLYPNYLKIASDIYNIVVLARHHLLNRSILRISRFACCHLDTVSVQSCKPSHLLRICSVFYPSHPALNKRL